MPALMLPIGPQDLHRLDFMADHAGELRKFNWNIGAEAKGPNLDGAWVDKLCRELRAIDPQSVFTWHPPHLWLAEIVNTDYLLTDLLHQAAIVANERRKQYGLRLLTIHGAAAPQPPVAEGFLPTPGSDEMITHLRRHVPMLHQLNQLAGGILSMETLYPEPTLSDDRTKISDISLYPGMWDDLVWFKRIADIRITVDSEHFFTANEILTRCGAAAKYPLPAANSHLYGITGYWLERGFWPFSPDSPRRLRFLELLGAYLKKTRPVLLHFGAGTSPYDQAGDDSLHLPFDFGNPLHRGILEVQLRYMARRRHVIGAVIEVNGLSSSGPYRLSRREPDDETAKRDSFLQVVDLIRTFDQNCRRSV